MEMSYEQIMKDLKNKVYRSVYFLAGQEPYFIDKITEYIASHALPEEARSFNQMIVYGKDTSAHEIVDLSRRFPMMSSHMVVIVREAQDLPSLEAFEHYFNSPMKSTILVINYKYKILSKRLKVYKALEKNGIYFESKKLYEDKIPLWIENYLKSKGYSMNAGVGMMLTEHLGNDLNRIAGELDKLMIVLPENEKTVTASHIEEYIGISKEYNNFELTNALARKDILKSNRIVKHFGNNPKNNPFIVTLSAIYFFFSKVLAYHYLPNKSRNQAAPALRVRPFFMKEYETAARNYSPEKLKQIIGMLRKYDVKSKGFIPVSTEEGDLLKELIYKILH
ncbi:MAG TPA: DNA polymerase III subunit delta [Bacteroidetes bacterium]|nr:DNA polymerase III subunit delta [Bacteroidota bacterium]